jgi:hypothetical protein
VSSGISLVVVMLPVFPLMSCCSNCNRVLPVASSKHLRLSKSFPSSVKTSPVTSVVVVLPKPDVLLIPTTSPLKLIVTSCSNQPFRSNARLMRSVEKLALLLVQPSNSSLPIGPFAALTVYLRVASCSCFQVSSSISAYFSPSTSTPCSNTTSTGMFLRLSTSRSACNSALIWPCSLSNLPTPA